MMLYESTVLLTVQILILEGIQEIAEPAHIWGADWESVPDDERVQQ
jgi:hypothetical protein